MAIGLEEEKDVVAALHGRAAGEVVEVDPEFLEWLKGGDEGAGLVLDAEHEHRVVVSRRGVGLPAEDKITRRRTRVSGCGIRDDLRADGHLVFRQRVERLVDEPVRRVLEKNDPAVRAFPGHLLKNPGDLGGERIADTRTKFTQSCLVRGAADRANASDRDIFFDGERGGHDLTVNRADGLRPQGSLAAVDQAP